MARKGWISLASIFSVSWTTSVSRWALHRISEVCGVCNGGGIFRKKQFLLFEHMVLDHVDHLVFTERLMCICSLRSRWLAFCRSIQRLSTLKDSRVFLALSRLLRSAETSSWRKSSCRVISSLTIHLKGMIPSVWPFKKVSRFLAPMSFISSIMTCPISKAFSKVSTKPKEKWVSPMYEY